jgi:mono/diheme cytochrome c family protein
VIFSKPVLDLGYALVTPRDAAARSLDDLGGRRVAVQFASPPQGMVAGRTDIQAVTVLSPEEGMRDLTQGKADAAFIWGPSAGWLNQSEFGGRYQVMPAEGEHLRWQSAIGFRRNEAPLRDAVDQALAGLGPKIDELRTKYGFPGAPQPVQHAAAAPAAPHGQPVAASAGQVAAGHKLFNDNCSHCHGPDAVQGIRQRDLRLLHHRYGGDMDQVFMTTVTHGRMSKGMPDWSGILNDKQFHAILAYLHSLQK